MRSLPIFSSCSRSSPSISPPSEERITLRRVLQDNTPVETIPHLPGVEVGGPVVVVVPLGIELFDRLALLLDPGEVLEVVDPLAVPVAELEHVVDAGAQEIPLVVDRRRRLRVRAVQLALLLEA